MSAATETLARRRSPVVGTVPLCVRRTDRAPTDRSRPDRPIALRMRPKFAVGDSKGDSLSKP